MRVCVKRHRREEGVSKTAKLINFNSSFLTIFQKFSFTFKVFLNYYSFIEKKTLAIILSDIRNLKYYRSNCLPL